MKHHWKTSRMWKIWRKLLSPWAFIIQTVSLSVSYLIFCVCFLEIYIMLLKSLFDWCSQTTCHTCTYNLHWSVHRRHFYAFLGNFNHFVTWVSQCYFYRSFLIIQISKYQYERLISYHDFQDLLSLITVVETGSLWIRPQGFCLWFRAALVSCGCDSDTKKLQENGFPDFCASTQPHLLFIIHVCEF